MSRCCHRAWFCTDLASLGAYANDNNVEFHLRAWVREILARMPHTLPDSHSLGGLDAGLGTLWPTADSRVLLALNNLSSFDGAESRAPRLGQILDQFRQA